jgi:hypothetical protein
MFEVMPPRHHPPHRRPRGHLPRSISAFVDGGRIEAILARVIDDPEARSFLARCMLDEGPAHHRGANYAIIALLGELLDRLGVDGATRPAGKTVPVPMRLPPHLEDEVEESNYPVELPVARLEKLAGGPRETEAMIDCLTDGPPQHAVANVVMVALLELALEAARR